MSMETEKLNVEGMSCGHCEARVKKAVGGLTGVSKVDVDLKGKTVSIQFEAEKVSLTVIKETIEDQGYTVK